MGLFKRRKEEDKRSIELSEEDLKDVKAGVDTRNSWCPKVDVSKRTEELTEEELDEVKAGITDKSKGRDDER